MDKNKLRELNSIMEGANILIAWNSSLVDARKALALANKGIADELETVGQCVAGITKCLYHEHAGFYDLVDKVQAFLDAAIERKLKQINDNLPEKLI